MMRLNLRTSYALSLLVLMFAQLQTGQAKQADADWYKRAAPETCVSYVAWNSEAEKPIEGNATQALMAQPEVREFIDDLRVRAGLMAPAMMSAEGMPKEKLDLMHEMSPKLVASIFERSGCMFIEEVTLTQNMEAPPTIRGAMLVDLGKDAEKFVLQMAEMFGSKDNPLTKIDLAATKAYQFDLQEAGSLYFGNAGQILVIAIGKEAYSGAIQRMKGTSQPAWLTKLEKQAETLSHVHSLGFLDMKSVLRSVRKAFGANSSVVGELLGVSNVDQVQMVAGLDDVGSVTHLLFDAVEVEGLLGMMTKHPVKSSLFESIPADSIGAIALTLDIDDLLDLIRSAETLMGGGNGFDQFKQALQANAGIDLEEDVLRNFGDSWALFNGASDGWVTGATLVGDVKNGKKLTATVEKLFKTIAKQVKDMPAYYRPKFFKQDYAGETIYSMIFPDAFVEMSFCIKQDRIFIGMFPQAVKTAVKGLPSQEVLLDDMKVQKLSESKFLKDEARLTGMTYVDAKLQTQFTYPYLQLTKAVISTFPMGEVSPEMSTLLNGVELPPARSIIPKLKPSMILVRTSDTGIEIEARQTIPSNSTAIGIPVVVGMLLPAVGQVRQAAKQTVSVNNLKQLALASLNYESAMGRYPTDGPKRGNDHAFSWRVHILPYLEQGNLYDQIKFDEPWDSDHNKALFAKTPEVFKSPTRSLPEGMTVYRGFAGDGKSKTMGVLGGSNGKGTRIGTITDGTSNTILVAEVPDDMATNWAKPECLSVDKEVVEKLLKSKGEMATAFCDGSVQQIPVTIEVDDLLALLGRSDGMVVNWNRFRPNNDPWNPRRQVERDEDPRFNLPGKKEKF